ncbi:MAG: hypothetical protein V2I46_12710 [Bacteroides sp.]|jgi:hypothetical protein|nr:hypothetical protein [Bacteroides sp.]
MVLWEGISFMKAIEIKGREIKLASRELPVVLTHLKKRQPLGAAYDGTVCVDHSAMIHQKMTSLFNRRCLSFLQFRSSLLQDGIIFYWENAEVNASVIKAFPAQEMRGVQGKMPGALLVELFAQSKVFLKGL